jgi:hypothetical protein
MNIEKMTFRCPIQICQAEHRMQIEGFTTNHFVIQLMSLQPIEINQCEKTKQLRNNLDQLQKLFDEIDIKIDDSFFEINKYCNELKKQIKIETEEKIKQIKILSDFLLKDVENFEIECKKSFDLAKQILYSSNVKIDSINQFCIEKIVFINNYELNEDLIKNLTEKTTEFIEKLKCDRQLLKQLLIDYKIISYNPNKSKIGSNFLGKVCTE